MSVSLHKRKRKTSAPCTRRGSCSDVSTVAALTTQTTVLALTSQEISQTRLGLVIVCSAVHCSVANASPRVGGGEGRATTEQTRRRGSAAALAPEKCLNLILVTKPSLDVQAHNRRAEARGRRAVHPNHPNVDIPQRESFRGPLRRPPFFKWLLNALRVLEFVGWVVLLRLLLALSAASVFFLVCLLIMAVVVGGPPLLCSVTDFMIDTFREVFTTFSQFIEDPMQRRRRR
ncbi:hypothetical protein HPB50_009290 [Hyalomma asiaticum]|uniref:Uncharacterized protein n=1 Tax=Hyalomma asiaticum TaxID=266040 RepID=A0ACB7THL3_HYAAI|nr:hypothetical protein HPB50_009290 [Hyalomma asiaticum]